jgi:hypothetical protein
MDRSSKQRKIRNRRRRTARTVIIIIISMNPTCVKKNSARAQNKEDQNKGR